MRVYTSQTFNGSATNKTLDSNQYVNEYSTVYLKSIQFTAVEFNAHLNWVNAFGSLLPYHRRSSATYFRHVSNEPTDRCVHTAHAHALGLSKGQCASKDTCIQSFLHSKCIEFDIKHSNRSESCALQQTKRSALPFRLWTLECCRWVVLI